jgi:molybdenum cofactor biosynthesis enzyme MoaA
MTQRLVEDHAKQISELTKSEPRPRAIICDHDAEDRATLERHLGMRTVGATKNVSAGIQAVASRLRVQADGKPRLFLLRDSLVDRDPMLVDAKRPLCTEEEIEGYVWSDKARKDEPVKENDHSMDGMRYMIAHRDMPVPSRRLVVH